MLPFSRRNVLKMFGATAAVAAAGSPVLRALADGSGSSDEFFILIHASGAWDVTLWSDPRNVDNADIDPATDANTRTDPITLWQDLPLASGANTFQLVHPKGENNVAFGPGIGEMLDLWDRMCVVNGIAMNTVSHPDGTTFSATGRHLAGGRASQPSVDTMLANSLGVNQTLPLVSVGFPSWHIGNLDPRSEPIRVNAVGNVAESLTRPSTFDSDVQRGMVTSVLTEEAKDLAASSMRPDAFRAFAVQYASLSQMLTPKVKSLFDTKALLAAQPQFTDKTKTAIQFNTDQLVNAAFAIEAMKANLVRCVSFAAHGFDTHNTNYQDQARIQQDLFALIARMIDGLDNAPHPTLMGHKLSEHTHILVVSDFCRSPHINITGGRDHHPNNSALIVSPKIKGKTVFGSTDPAQLLPNNVDGFSDGPRPPTPADVLATFVNVVGVDPRDYMREGEPIKAILAEGT
jgi:uncharacterized protein (DUF1501 family)